MAIVLLVTILLPSVGAIALALAPRSLAPTVAWGLALAVSLVTLAMTVALCLGYRGAEPGSFDDLISDANAYTTQTREGEMALAFDVDAAFPDPQFTLADSEQEYGPAWLTLGPVPVEGYGTSLDDADDGDGSPDQLGAAIRLGLGLDGVSLWLFALTSLLSTVSIVLTGVSPRESDRGSLALLLLLETALLGLFASLDVVLFYICFEVSLIPLFFLIGLHGGPERRRAAITFVIYTLVGSLLMLLGLIGLVLYNYQYGSGVLTTSMPALTQGLATIPEGAALVSGWYDLAGGPQQWIFWLLFAGFAIKTPLFPLHNWLPLAYSQSPPATRVVLAGVVSKLGVYGFLRFAVGMTPLGIQAQAPLLMGLAVAGILYGALVALVQKDAVRLVAYSSVSHMGFIALGLFALNATAMDGAVIQMVSHGLTTGALFATLAVVESKYGTTEMDRLGGIWFQVPVLSFFLIVAALGSAALPGLSGFIGEFPILMGTFASDRVMGILASVGMILGAYYLLTMLRRVVFGPPRSPESLPVDSDRREAHASETDTNSMDPNSSEGRLTMGLALAPLAILILVVGIYPRPFLQAIRPAAEGYAARVISSVRIDAQGQARPIIPRRTTVSEDLPTGGLGGG